MKSAWWLALVSVAACAAAPSNVTAPVAPGENATTPPTVLAPPLPPAASTSVAEEPPDVTSDGLPIACEALFTRLLACLHANGGGAVADEAIKTMRQSWAAMAQDPQRREDLEALCTGSFSSMYPKCH